MKLYCVRHGHAEQEIVSDNERPLNGQGNTEVARVAEYLAHRGVHVSHVMHSNKLRAQQTATILAAALSLTATIEVADFLEPSQRVVPLIKAIQHWNDDTMLVGHMPFMSQLVSTLILGEESEHNIVRFPPGTVVCLERYEHDQWVLNWVVRPDLIPEHGY